MCPMLKPPADIQSEVLLGKPLQSAQLSTCFAFYSRMNWAVFLEATFSLEKLYATSFDLLPREGDMITNTSQVYRWLGKKHTQTVSCAL